MPKNRFMIITPLARSRFSYTSRYYKGNYVAITNGKDVILVIDNIFDILNAPLFWEGLHGHCGQKKCSWKLRTVFFNLNGYQKDDTYYFAEFQILSVIFFQMRPCVTVRYSQGHSSREKRPQFALKILLCTLILYSNERKIKHYYENYYGKSVAL